MDLNRDGISAFRFNPNAEVAGVGAADRLPSECARPRAQQRGIGQAAEKFSTNVCQNIAAPGTGAVRRLGNSTWVSGFNCE